MVLTDIWICSLCGAENIEAVAPHGCPICGHWRDGFGPNQDNNGSDLKESVHSLPELQQDDLSAILNPGMHFSSLEELEVEVVAKCGISRHSLVDRVVDATMSNENFGIDECIGDLNGILEAFKLLQQRGFCSSRFNILVQDPDRHEVALTIPISRMNLEALLNKAQSTKFSTSISSVVDSKVSQIGAVPKPNEESNLVQEELLGDLQIVLRTGTCAERRLTLPPFSAGQALLDASQLCLLTVLGNHGSSSEGDLYLFRFIIPFLAIGLASYSGSHVNQFDLTAYGSSVEAFQLLDGFSFRQRPLACLSEYVGGPAWIFERPGAVPQSYMISISIHDFADLWGPVQVAEDKFGHFRCIYTERGIITCESVIPASQVVRHGELVCHWERIKSQYPGPSQRDTATSGFASTSSAQGPDEIGCENPGPHSTTAVTKNDFNFQTKLLIGTKQGVTDAGLYLRESCQIDTDIVRRERALALQFPGVSTARLQMEEVGISLGAGQFIVPSAQVIWKRIPGRRLKEMILFYCQHNTAALSHLLNLRVGLEVSICTGNAKRITLWETIKLLYTQASDTNGDENRTVKCQHKSGSLDCVRECWNVNVETLASKSIRNQENDAYHSVIKASISDLSMTGVDDDGCLQAWWPFTKGIHTYRIEDKGKDGTYSRWIPMLRDNREIATFAVMSKRCLGYESVDLLAAKRISRICSGSHSSSSTDHPKELSRTVLESSIKLHPEFVSLLANKKALSLRTHLQIGDVGSLEVRNEDEVQLVLFKSGLKAMMSKIGYCVSQAKWGSTHYELVDDERATAKTMHVIVM